MPPYATRASLPGTREQAGAKARSRARMEDALLLACATAALLVRPGLACPCTIQAAPTELRPVQDARPQQRLQLHGLKAATAGGVPGGKS